MAKEPRDLKSEIQEWMIRGINEGAKYLIVASDSFDYEYYPVFVSADESLDVVKAKISSTMSELS